jgi:6-pyruvoyltetrahydropterin/6-carboxytetrahydropterin synthase
MQITRRFEFDAAHRVLGHGGKCRHLHGHRYAAEVTLAPVAGEGLDALGMVIDFGEIKQVIGEWIDKHLDHNILLHSADPLMKLWEGIATHGIQATGESIFDGKDPFMVVIDSQSVNPTAENLAILLHRLVSGFCRRHWPSLRCAHVRLYETPSCWADYAG